MARIRTLISTQRNPAERPQTITQLMENLAPHWQASTEKAAEMDRWYYNELEPDDMPRLPKKVTGSIKDLRVSSPTSWAKMIADSSTQDLIVDGLRMSNGEQAPAWSLWQRNGLDARQRPVHDGVIRHGKAFNLVGRAVGRLDGEPTAYIRGKSALNCDAFFRDDFDEYADYFVEGHIQLDEDGARRYRWDLWDEEKHHVLTSELDFSKMTLVESTPHNMGLCPVVRFTFNIDLTGRTIGEIEPYITVFKRINQSTMDRLVVQRFGAWVIKYLAGLQKPGTEAEQRAQAVALSMTDLLIMEDPKARAGALPATPLDGYIRSREADIRDLAAVSQTPSFQMLGLSDNVGAEGLAAAMSSHDRKMEVLKLSLGESWETSHRLAGFAMGDPQIANDFESRMHWKDTRPESFQTLAQGLATLAEKLEIAPELLWPKVLDQSDIQRAERLREARKAEAQMEADIEAQRQAEIQRTAGGNGAAAR